MAKPYVKVERKAVIGPRYVITVGPKTAYRLLNLLLGVEDTMGPWARKLADELYAASEDNERDAP